MGGARCGGAGVGAAWGRGVSGNTVSFGTLAPWKVGLLLRLAAPSRTRNE